MINKWKGKIYAVVIHIYRFMILKKVTMGYQGIPSSLVWYRDLLDGYQPSVTMESTIWLLSAKSQT